MSAAPSTIGGADPWQRTFCVLASSYVALLLLGHLASVLGGFGQIVVIVFLAWLLAFVLSSAVAWLESHSSLRRGALVGLVYAAAIVGGGIALLWSAGRIATELGQLAAEYPETRERVLATLAGLQQRLLGNSGLDLVHLFDDLGAQVGRIGTEALATVPGLTATAAGGLVLVVVLSLYMVMDSERIVARLTRLIPDRWEDEATMLQRSVARSFGGFLRAQLVLAAVQAVLTIAIGMVVDLPYLFLIVVLSAASMFVPVFGPPLALIPPLLALVIYRPEWLVIAAPFLIVVQTIIVNWLQPRLLQDALGLHPLVVLIGLLAGAQIAGFWGALFGIPIIAVVFVFLNYVVNLATLHDTEEVEVDDVIAEVRREAPDAEPEDVMAAAADLAEERHEAAKERRPEPPPSSATSNAAEVRTSD